MLDYRVSTFLTLYDEMNYRRTAERLNMTQPGVTQHIHYLENYYGVKLFEYNGRTLSRTKNAITDRGFSLDSFKQCTSINNFSVICDVVANTHAITFAYEPIARCRDDITTFTVSDFQISGEFNFVYCNEHIARKKIEAIFN